MTDWPCRIHTSAGGGNPLPPPALFCFPGNTPGYRSVHPPGRAAEGVQVGVGTAPPGGGTTTRVMRGGGAMGVYCRCRKRCRCSCRSTSHLPPRQQSRMAMTSTSRIIRVLREHPLRGRLVGSGRSSNHGSFMLPPRRSPGCRPSGSSRRTDIPTGLPRSRPECGRT